MPDGEFVDVPVADRARRLLELAQGLTAEHEQHLTSDVTVVEYNTEAFSP